MPYGWSGVLSGAAMIFFAYIGFDSVSTHAEEARNPKTDVPIGIISSLAVCTVLYIAVAAVVTGMIPYPQIPLERADRRGVRRKHGLRLRLGDYHRRGAHRHHQRAVGDAAEPAPRAAGHGPRRPAAASRSSGRCIPRFRTPHKATILTGIVLRPDGLAVSRWKSSSHMVNIGTLFAFVVVCSAVWLMRRLNPDAERPFRTPTIILSPRPASSSAWP